MSPLDDSMQQCDISSPNAKVKRAFAKEYLLI